MVKALRDKSASFYEGFYEELDLGSAAELDLPSANRLPLRVPDPWDKLTDGFVELGMRPKYKTRVTKVGSGKVARAQATAAHLQGPASRRERRNPGGVHKGETET